MLKAKIPVMEMLHRGSEGINDADIVNGVNCTAPKVWEEGQLLALGSTRPVLRALRMLSL